MENRRILFLCAGFRKTDLGIDFILVRLHVIDLLTHSHTMTPFDVPGKQSF